MTTSTENLPTVIDGYDLDAERARYGEIPDVTVRGHALNRGSATVSIEGEMTPPRHLAAREEHRGSIVPTTLDPDSPVLELGWPLSGPFVRCSAGVYMDMYLAVAQKILDPSHPRIAASVQALHDLGLMTRREINTDDYLIAAEGAEGLHTPQELAALATGLAAQSFEGSGDWRVFLSNSGAEAVEAMAKIAWQTRYKRFLDEHGFETLERVAADLGIGRMSEMDDEPSRDEPLLEDYPFFLVGCWSGFHGRTLGALHFTTSKKSQRVGYPQTRWVRRVKFNGNAADLADLIDPRPINEILDADGGVRGVIEAGRIPRDLFAGFLAEPFQGEGGYIPGDPEWFQTIADTVRANGGLMLLDEVQTVGRTGTLFFSEQLGIQPDVISVAKGVVVGMTLCRAGLADRLHGGWHSNTWGGGKIFDNQVAYAALDTLANHRDPVLGGISYLENERIKGKYLAAHMERLVEKHDLLESFENRGMMMGLSIRRREEIVVKGWERGLKLLGCGSGGEVSRLRILFLADTLAREIDEFVRVFDELLTEVASG